MSQRGVAVASLMLAPVCIPFTRSGASTDERAPDEATSVERARIATVGGIRMVTFTLRISALRGICRIGAK